MPPFSHRPGARRPGSSPSRLLPIVVLALGSILGSGRAAEAGLVIEVLNSTAAPGGLGSFDVVLQNVASNPATDGPESISAFSFGLSVAASSGVAFTAADTLTTPSFYIFGVYQQAGTPFAFTTDGNGNDPFPGTSFQASDAVNNPATSSTTLAVGATFGLGRVSYSVAAGTAPGAITVSLLSDFDSLSDQNNNSPSFTEMNGQITVAVPEPSSLITCLAGGATVLLGRHLRGGLRPRYTVYTPRGV